MKATSAMRFEVMEITPEIAAQWFAKNEGNRKLREPRAAALARSIEAGKFRLTHQAIALTKGGRLLDGQHRLRAVMLAGKSIMSAVAFNVPEAAFEVMDAGLTRKMHERLRSDPRHTTVCTTAFKLLVNNRAAAEYEIETLIEVLGPALVKMDSVPRPAKCKIGKAPQEAAIALHMQQAIKDKDEDRQMHINWTLGQLRKGDVTGAKPIVQSYYRQLLEGVKNHDLGVAAVTDQFARAWVAFDPENAETSRMQITDHSAILREAREAFRDVSEGVFEDLR